MVASTWQQDLLRRLDAALATLPTDGTGRADRRQPVSAVRPLHARGGALESRRLHQASALLSLAVLGDSAVEHYRGAFFNRAMVLPLLSSSLTFLANLHGVRDARPSRHPVRHGIQIVAAATGLLGTGFHLYNIGKREGGASWNNLFYGAPIGAPFALLLAGLTGTVAENVRGPEPAGRKRLLGLPAGRLLAAISAGGLLGTTAEVGLLHFRGAYHNPFMFLPVTIPPVAGALLTEAAFDRRPNLRWFSRPWLRLTMLLGFAGVGFHIYGVHRNMGGWRNWSQNVPNGPPIPAPPSFTGLALAGLAALDMLGTRRDA